MEVRGPQALTTGQRNVHEIDRSVTKRRIGQSQSAGALQQTEVGQAEKIDGGTKCIGVVDDSGDQSERRGVPLRRHGVGGPELHVTARTHLGKQRAQWSRHSSNVGTARSSHSLNDRFTPFTAGISIAGAFRANSRYSSSGARGS